MGFEFNDLFNAVQGTEFEEVPVDIETFWTSPDYLDMAETPLSDYQYLAVKNATQIYRKETLEAAYGWEKGNMRWKETKKECIFKIGKGGGKDFVSTVACAYVVYLLLCLKDPAKYYNKPPGDSIDILNIAINADQARNVFFKNFLIRIKRSPWFAGKFTEKNNEVTFDKNITVYSGHSEKESWEGYNVMFVVLDEISGFSHDTRSGGNQKTAAAIYKMYRASVTSRFPDFGKLVLLSFPRFKGDFISERYDQVVAEKEIIKREHTFKVDPDDPNSYSFTIQWDEDHIISYKTPSSFALCRPSWDFNPTKEIDMYMEDFFNDVVDSLMRFACMPPDAQDAFFKDRAKVEAVFTEMNPIDSNGAFADWFRPHPDKTYYVHVDLARVQDRAAVALAHVEKFTQQRIGGFFAQGAAPVVKIDLVKFWEPKKNQNIDFKSVRDFIIDLQRRGFNIGRVTFDRWESEDMMDYLNTIGMRSERLSVAKKHYTELAMLIHEERVKGPMIKLAVDELLALQLLPNDKVDHPRSGGKDLADAITGAVFNAVALTPKSDTVEVQVRTLTDYRSDDEPAPVVEKKAEKKEMPNDLLAYLEGMRLV